MSALSLTRQDRKILSALCDVPQTSNVIAKWAEINTAWPGETVTRHCIKLERLGLAEKVGTRMFPAWRLSDAGRHAIEELEP